MIRYPYAKAATRGKVSGLKTYLLGQGPRVYSGHDVVDFVGTVINPKTLRPYFVFRFNVFDCVITIPTVKRPLALMGSGFLDHQAQGFWGASAGHFQVPRAHCPGGVAHLGEALGTCLYVGMAITGLFLDRLQDTLNPEQMRLPVPGEGVCSDENAEKDAVEWWLGSVKRGLAYSDHFRSDKGDVTGYCMPLDVPIARGLVLDVTPGLRADFDLLRKGTDVKEEVLSLDLSEVQDDEAVEYFYSLAYSWGATEEEVRAMQARVEKDRDLGIGDAWPDDPDEALDKMTRDAHGMRVNPTRAGRAARDARDARDARRARDARYREKAAAMFAEFVDEEGW